MPATMIRPNIRIQRPVESFEREMMAEPVPPRAQFNWDIFLLWGGALAFSLIVWWGVYFVYTLVLQ